MQVMLAQLCSAHSQAGESTQTKPRRVAAGQEPLAMSCPDDMATSGPILCLPRSIPRRRELPSAADAPT